MFFTYLWRELRRRARQATFIAVGLALGIGLVITVTAASTGVKNAEGTVLHSLYGVGTDITVTKAPAASSSGAPGGGSFSFRQSFGSGSQAEEYAKIDNNTLSGDFTLASITSASVTGISKLSNVAAAAGGLTLNDRTITGTIPAVNFNNGGAGGGGGGGWRRRRFDRRRRQRQPERFRRQLQHQQLHRDRRRHRQRGTRAAVHRHHQLRADLRLC